MYKVREDEPDYAFIADVQAAETNCYGSAIQLVELSDPLAGQSLNINGDTGIGNNPNRHKQHGFYFTADNCIACHACEAACAEKNDTPAHLAFRSVGYLEGGSYPAVKRLNISMACNHCDNPVCLKGCPTRAYTKFAEYGAVLQDPDICFGCGYCTWVCPYNAPQLDPNAGHVSKCNMCVDRLEAGLKPACAAACLGGALDFGVIETKPEGREQLETRIPGFPDPSITHPNIRFQQTGSLPREMVRTDSTPLRYIRDDRNVKPDPGIKGGQGQYRSAVLTRSNKRRSWGLGSLRSREDPLVLFTLITQAVVGAFLVLFLGSVSGLPGLDFQAHLIAFPVAFFGMIVLLTFGLVLSTLHLGRPYRFYRAFNNLRYSPVSREVAAVAVFYNLLGVYAVLTGMPQLFAWLPEGLVMAVREISGWLAAVAGPAALYFMHSIYRIPARPYWNHWQVLTAFYGSMLTLGPLFAALIFVPVMLIQGLDYLRLLQFLSLPIALGLLLEGFGLYRHARHLKSGVGEADASGQQQLTTFGKTYLVRNIGLGVNTALVLTLAGLSLSGAVGLSLWAIIAVSITALAVVGRALFYAVVIPTTMPGAFFWNNPGFQEHARHSGLAEMQQVGVQIVEH